MLYTYGTRQLSWYDAPPDDEMTDEEREEWEEEEQLKRARIRKHVHIMGGRNEIDNC